MLLLSVLFVILYWLSLKWFKTYWKRRGSPPFIFRFSLDQASLRAGKVTAFCVRQPLARSSLRSLNRKSCWDFVGGAEQEWGGFAFWVTVDSIRRMTPEELFTAALGLGRQWRVAQCRFDGEPKRLELRLEHRSRGTF
jgi:hypothetical protein